MKLARLIGDVSMTFELQICDVARPPQVQQRALC
jgi:hypothetical protein